MDVGSFCGGLVLAYHKKQAAVNGKNENSYNSVADGERVCYTKGVVENVQYKIIHPYGSGNSFPCF